MTWINRTAPDAARARVDTAEGASPRLPSSEFATSIDCSTRDMAKFYLTMMLAAMMSASSATTLFRPFTTIPANDLQAGRGYVRHG